jgi:hypothetical protein
MNPDKFPIYVHGLYLMDAMALLAEAEVPYFTVLDDRAGSGAYRVDVDWMGMDEHPPRERMWDKLRIDYRFEVAETTPARGE